MASGASRLRKTTTSEAVPLRKKQCPLRFRRLHPYPHVCRVVAIGRISVGNSEARRKKEEYQLDLKRSGKRYLAESGTRVGHTATKNHQSGNRGSPLQGIPCALRRKIETAFRNKT